MSRIVTIINGHLKSWYRSKSNIFWTIAFPLLLIVLFGAIFGNGSTKFDLYLQNQDLNNNVPTPLSQGYVNVLNQTGAFSLHIVAAEQQNPLLAIVVARNDLERLIVTVLLRIEHAPAEVKGPGQLGAEQAVHARVTIGDVDAGDLIVAFVLKPARA